MTLLLRLRLPRRVLIGLALLPLTLGYAYSQNAKRTSVEVPFEFIHNQIVVSVKVAGKGPYDMLIDTDTDPSAIDAATAKDLGLQVGSKGLTATGGGTEVNTVYPTRLSNLELGGVTAKEVLAATIDLAKISERLGRPIHGVLGYSFLKDRIIQIDYGNSKLKFWSDSPYPGIQFAPNTVNQLAFPFKYEDGSLIIDSVFVNNEKMKATLDTGSSGKIALTPDAVAMLGLEATASDGKAGESTGYNGKYEYQEGILKSVRLGRFSVDSVLATFWLPKTGHDKKKYQVNIGNDFFKDFIMTFDFRGKIVVFERVD